MKNLENLKNIISIIEALDHTTDANTTSSHPMLGKRCIIRTYSAGVHIGTVERVDKKEVLLSDSLRLWKWENGGLSLSAVALNGINGGRLNKTGEIFLTEAIEFIPLSAVAEQTFGKFIEDDIGNSNEC